MCVCVLWFFCLDTKEESSSLFWEPHTPHSDFDIGCMLVCKIHWTISSNIFCSRPSQHPANVAKIFNFPMQHNFWSGVQFCFPQKHKTNKQHWEPIQTLLTEILKHQEHFTSLRMYVYLICIQYLWERVKGIARLILIQRWSNPISQRCSLNRSDPSAPALQCLCWLHWH